MKNSAGGSPSIGGEDISTLEEELQENPDLVYDPLKIRKMLLIKIGQLGQSIRNIQGKNFEIEDAILDKLRLLKDFNENLQTVSQQSAQQAKSFQDSL